MSMHLLCWAVLSERTPKVTYSIVRPWTLYPTTGFKTEHSIALYISTIKMSLISRMQILIAGIYQTTNTVLTTVSFRSCNTATPWSRYHYYHYYPYFIDEKTEAQKVQVACPRPHWELKAELMTKLSPWLLHSAACMLTTATTTKNP